MVDSIRRLGILTVLVAAAVGQDGPVPSPLESELPFVTDQSAWRQQTRYDGRTPSLRDRGVFAVGNGRAFCHLGYGERANTMLAVTGPRYQTHTAFAPDGQFGRLTVELRVNGKRIELDEQRLARTRGANFVVTEDRSDSIALRTLTFAPPDGTDLIRLVEVRNLGAGSLEQLDCVVDFGEAEAVGGALIKRHGEGRRAAIAALSMDRGAVDGGRLVARIGALAPGEHWTTALRVATATGHDTDATLRRERSLEAAVELARSTDRWWRDKLRDTTSYDTDHTKLRDLVDDWKVNVLVLRCAQSGVIVPMLHRRVASVRDNVGAMLLLLRFHLWDEARDVLRFWHRAARTLGRVPDRVPLDLDLGEDPEIDWSELVVQSGEIPSWMILQHHWYWRTTRDTQLIHDHWLFLDACLKGQRREQDVLMTFLGDEPYLGGDLYRLPQLAGATDLIAHDPRRGRQAYSLINSTLFLIAMQSMGELLDGRDRDLNPEKYAADPDAPRPGASYATRTYRLMTEIEKRFWSSEDGFFAPARSPVNGDLHRVPFANANLMPLWVGWTFPTSEKSRDNLRNSVGRLVQRGASIGTSPTVGYVTGDVQGMLLCALSERDAEERLDALDALLAMAEPSGDWARLHRAGGVPVAGPDSELPERLAPHASGVNVDAILYAVTGLRQATVPNWDKRDIRLEFWLPHEASYFSVENSAKDGRVLNLFFREETSMMTEEEREANDQQTPENRRDPNRPHRRMHLVVDLVDGKPDGDYYDVTVNSQNTVFPRFLWHEPPRVVDERQHDPRKIVESVFCKADDDPFMTRIAPKPRQRNPVAGGDTICLTARSGAEQLVPGATLFDTGLPFTIEELRPLLLDANGGLVHRRLYLDWSHDAPAPATFTPAKFWSGRAWRELLTAFEAAGGTVATPGFLTAFDVDRGDGFEPATDDDGQITFDDDAATRRVRFSIESETARDAVLRLGSDAAIQASLNGQPLFARDARGFAVPDTETHAVRLNAGTNLLELTLEGREPTLFVRVD